MQCWASFQEMEILGESLAYDYMMKLKSKSVCFDIESFAADYLKLDIVYETIAEEDKTKLGFASDGITPLMVMRDNGPSAVVFPKDTIVLDRFLNNSREYSRKRFILAHEAAHVVLDRHLPEQAHARYKSSFSADAPYSFEDHERIFSMGEAFVDRLGASIIMARFLVNEVLERRNRGNMVISYEGAIFPPRSKLAIQQMANDLGVSYSAMINRLRELKLLEIRPVGEYLTALRKAGR